MMTEDTLNLKPGDDLRMMQTPDAWPQYPRLPIKRGSASAPYEMGVLVVARGVGRHVVLLTNLFDARLQALDEGGHGIPTMSYPDFEAMIADGWIVD